MDPDALTLSSSTELCRLLGDPTRLRLIRLLEAEELSVAELTKITGLTQSRVSTHLGKLRDARLVRDRRNGTSSYYSLDLDALPVASRSVVDLLREGVSDPLFEEDTVRLVDALRARDRGGWAASVAGRMDRSYSPGRTWEAAVRALLGWMKLGRVLDVASGDGVLAELLAGSAEHITCVDLSERVVEAGRERLAHHENVEFVEGDMGALPFPDDAFDQIALMNALPYAESPTAVLREACRVLAPGGTIVGTTVAPHKLEEAVRPYDHVQLGVDPKKIRKTLEQAGLTVTLCEETCEERRSPNFRNVTFHATRPGGSARRTSSSRSVSKKRSTRP